MIKIENLTKEFGKNIVIKDFNYQIPDGTMIALMGKSGCGKSTFLNMLGLLDVNYNGKILYDNKQLSKEKEKIRNEYIRNNINYLFQNYALIDTDSVYDNLLLALEYEKISKETKKNRINEVLGLVDLKDFNNKKVYTLSGGEQQRVALARTMLKKGNIILADEPTGNLDNENSNKVMNLLKKLQKQGRTIIIVTHDERIANQCDDVIHW
ncbi:MAG: ABC transporter ATP-binding protein [Bacilli bacterium]